ncbi:calcineurin-like phosphoesterase C-terminal domain-containing protein [Sphingobacterium hungaricum]|uniref:Metallophosphoesterase n=1 Tax=Sphingobacterium hungaricum TaxID=2082723 RepID=A0A928UZF9_9SPHI|nr:calcineurin-like phosphoesterase family protein [Sphingobacterium hungaricum]MBE8714260.1 metallophosphoesterase [Sphingobacterium hungaricum]
MNYKTIIYPFLLLLFISASCGKKLHVEQPTNGTIEISQLDIPKNFEIVINKDFELIGNGFKAEDLIQFRSLSENSMFTIPIKEIKGTQAILPFSEKIQETSYDLTLVRNDKSIHLANVDVSLIFNKDIPEKEGMTVKGTVYSKGKGVANVIVSDGVEVTSTDANGIYYLASAKKNGYVFISVPSNYEVATKNTIPQFYKSLNGETSKSEIKDFELTSVNNENHTLLVMADMHLANRNDDLSQFQKGFMADAKALIAKTSGKVYGLTLGDQTWDAYWYSNSFALPEYLNQMKDLHIPIYNTIGNHDNDPYVANDWLSENAYRKTIGPTYYSFNIGKVHYIVLDNTVFNNNGGSIGVVGDRSYEARITQNQLDWLKKDLETISDKSAPIILAMHIPLHTNPNINNYNYYLKNSKDLVANLEGFSNIQVLTGHTHVNYRIESPTLMEHNVAAVCATWWWTGRSGYAGNHISKDGSPGGYQVWENTGKDLTWYYKSIGYDKTYQFRAYDLNNVHITADKFTPKANDTYKAKVPTYAKEYATKNSKNEILLNVWGYEPNWKITVTENGKPLAIQRVHKPDPLHIISYSMQRLNVNANPTDSFVSSSTSHLFLATASDAKSTIDITVEDRFGNKSTQKMVRPKEFSTSMN